MCNVGGIPFDGLPYAKPVVECSQTPVWNEDLQPEKCGDNRTNYNSNVRVHGSRWDLVDDVSLPVGVVAGGELS